MEMPRRQGRPVRQIAALWFAAGLAIASFVGYFFDNQEGSARRHMAYDKLMSTGRRMGEWGGGKSRHLRNKAMGAVAQVRPPDESDRVASGG
jgi:hypothetical protein